MPLFALPLDPSSTRPSSRSHLYPRTSTKRKRSTHTDQEDLDSATSADELNLPAPDADTQWAASSAASTNPLSLSRDDIEQYRVAGLALDQELPSRNVPGFPHRGLPKEGLFWGDDDADERAMRSERDDGDKRMTETEQETDMENEGERKGSRLKTRHLGVLTGILHRCLLEGDIARAKRAWAMLLRAEVNGKGIELRNSGYWGIGAELLIRGETANTDADATTRQAETSDELPMNEAEESSPPPIRTQQQDLNSTWGTPAGFAKAKEYYERLILQHPYKSQFKTSINALTFWPALLSISIYSIQSSHHTTLKHLSSLQKQQLSTSASADSPSSSASDQDAEEDVVEPMQDEDDNTFLSHHAQQRRSVRRRARIRDQMWIARDDARRAALMQAETLAKRMDALMTGPPFLDDATLLRLRGMVALYVGDLHVPALPSSSSSSPQKGRGGNSEDDEDDDEDDEDENVDDRDENEAQQHHPRGGGKAFFFTRAEIKDRRFRNRHRRIERERGLERRREAVERARRAFEAARVAGADVEREIGMVRAAEEGDEDEGEEVEEEEEDEDEDEDEGDEN